MIELNEEIIASSIVLVGIDPGRENTGYARYFIHADTFEIQAIDARTITIKDLCISKRDVLRYGETQASMLAHQDNFTQLFGLDTPAGVLCESPFFNAGTPSAFKSLTTLIANICTALERAASRGKIEYVDPPTVKKCVGVKGTGKQEVKNAVARLNEISEKLAVPIDELSEHAIDAIAVGYYGYLKHFQQEHPFWQTVKKRQR